jgi:oligopeptide/dipeptide ABC transporter ATP-binding protein
MTDLNLAADTSSALLRVRDLKVALRRRGSVIHAVNGVSLDLDRGERHGLVGESGSGKSILCLAIMQLLPPDRRSACSGSIRFDGRELVGMSQGGLRKLRGPEISMIFQDPLSSLNPVLTIGEQLTESLRTHTTCTRKAATDRAVSMLRSVGLPEPRSRLLDYPHQLSGGMRQRVMIAIALALQPKLVIADEPTTALDVTVQAQILRLLRQLTEEQGAALILVTHDLGVVASAAERVSVMYGGSIVESAQTEELFTYPHHPYTIGLLDSLPRPDSGRDTPLLSIPGTPQEIHEEPRACSFAPRCRYARDRCGRERPLLEVLRGPGSHPVACWYPRLERRALPSSLPQPGAPNLQSSGEG